MAHFDLFVIGGGSGGVACARRSASYGAKVGLAEASRLGGTCVIRGCVPKKLMRYGAHFSDHFKAAKAYGWRFAEPRIEFGELLTARNKEIQRLNGIYANMLQKAGVEIFAGFATLAPARGEGAAHAILIGDERHTADKVLIAVGGRPSVPEVEGIEHTLTSDQIMEDIYDLPKRLSLVGAGYIGVEIASIFNGFGVETTMILRGDQPLRGFDEDLRREIASAMEQGGIQIRPGTVVKRIEKTDKEIVLHTNVGPIATDLVVYATGRSSKPQTAGLGLEGLGVRLKQDGAVYVDATYETNVKGIFAVGDCSDHAGNGMDGSQHDLTPVAIAEGRSIAERAFNNNPNQVAYDTIPTAIFSIPEASSVGMTDKQARDLGYDITVFKTRFRAMLHTLTGEDAFIFMKIVVDRNNDRVLGCQMVGADAGEIIQGLAIALTAGATKAQFDATVGVHPSAAEEFVTMYQPAVE